ncbi:MAG: ABC transporter permease, partial [Gemmatimonadetes bacterium]|nr:ABC transporter permease [Gemmatimonadota bacterium]
MNDLGRDIRLACRALARTPGFLVVSVLVVGLGIAVVTTVFSLADSLLFRPVPGIRDPDAVRTVSAVFDDGTKVNTFSNPAYTRLRDASGVFDELAAYTTVAMSVERPGGAERVWGMVASPNYFRVLGTAPRLGRFFAAEPSDANAAVLSHALWRRRFAGDPAVVGRPLTLNGQSFTIIGVAPEEFTGTTRGFGPELWVPLAAQPILKPGTTLLSDPSTSWLQLVGRIRGSPGVEAASERLAQVVAHLPESGSVMGRTRRVTLTRADQLNGPLRIGALGLLSVLMLACGCLLLAAVSNVSGMLLARASLRSRDTAIRLALGISRRRLLRQFLLEGLALSLAGALVGMLLSSAAVRVLNRVEAPVDVPLALNLHLDGRVAGFALLIALFLAAAFVLVPTREARRTDVMNILRNGGQTASRESTRLRGRFVMVQTAATLLLLTITGVFSGSIRKGLGTDPGFQVKNVGVGTVSTEIRGLSAPAGQAFRERLLRQVRSLPEVEEASFTSALPLGSTSSRTMVSREGADGGGGPGVDFARVGAGYFRTLRIPLVRGREFQPSDRAGGARVAVVNQALGRLLWGGDDPIGQQLRTGDAVYRVVGVARTGKYHSLSEESQPFLYLPLDQEYAPEVSL